MGRFKKLIGASGSAVLIAGGLALAVAAPANATGSCVTPPYNSSGGYITASCIGNVHITWKCSTDLWGTVNDKLHSFGSGSTYTFKGCDEGYPYSIGFYGV